MNPELLIQQTRIESQALEHVTRALESILSWQVTGEGYSRKLSSVRFYTELYQRYLERLFALEEVDGFMESVSQLRPELANQIERLEQEHERFRRSLRKSLVRIDLTSPDRLDDFDRTCAQLLDTINQVREHLRQENELLVESFNQDTGGEG